jgi:hypothetical protein
MNKPSAAEALCIYHIKIYFFKKNKLCKQLSKRAANIFLCAQNSEVDKPEYIVDNYPPCCILEYCILGKS